MLKTQMIGKKINDLFLFFYSVRFIADVRESVAECQDMERVRLAFELNRQQDARMETNRAMSAASSIAQITDNEV